MKPFPILSVGAALLIAVLSTGCESSHGGDGYYDASGHYYPYYDGGYHDHDYDLSRPGGPRPSHPIANPPPSMMRPTPMPMGGGGFGGRR